MLKAIYALENKKAAHEKDSNFINLAKIELVNVKVLRFLFLSLFQKTTSNILKIPAPAAPSAHLPYQRQTPYY